MGPESQPGESPQAAPTGARYVLFSDVSLWALIVTNAVTIYLAAVQHWNLFDIVIVYWAQSVIIGIFNVVRMLTMENFSIENITINGQPAQSKRGVQIFMAAFFAIHYGFFHLGYLIFILSGIFTGTPDGGAPSAGLLVVGAPIALFFANHLFSFMQNHQADAQRRANIGVVMFFPYVRIIPMHLTIIFGGLLGVAGKGMWTLVLFLTLKAAADVLMHIVEHRTTSQI